MLLTQLRQQPGEGDRRVEVGHVDDVEPAQRLFGLHERPVGDGRRLSARCTQGRGRRRGRELLTAQTPGARSAGEGDVAGLLRLQLLRRLGVPLLLAAVDEDEVLRHVVLLRMWSPVGPAYRDDERGGTGSTAGRQVTSRRRKRSSAASHACTGDHEQVDTAVREGQCHGSRLAPTGATGGGRVERAVVDEGVEVGAHEPRLETPTDEGRPDQTLDDDDPAQHGADDARRRA